MSVIPGDGPDAIKAHWHRDDLRTAVMAVLATSGKDLDALTIEDLAPLDQFHGGGLTLTRRLAAAGGLHAGLGVLDVGGGLGGAARTLAREYGCRVTVLDLVDSYVEAGRMLTALMDLEDLVAFQVGDALDLPFEDGRFDVVWTQNSGMNIADKARLYAGFHRVLRPGGCLVTQEPTAGPRRPPIYPLMWALDASSDHIRPPAELRAAIEGAGFRVISWAPVELDLVEAAERPPAAQTIQGLVMGEAQLEHITLASRRNEREQRVTMIHGVFKRDE